MNVTYAIDLYDDERNCISEGLFLFFEPQWVILRLDSIEDLKSIRQGLKKISEGIEFNLRRGKEVNG